MAQMTEATLSPVCVKDALPERPLVQTDPYLCGGVAASERVGSRCHLCRNGGKETRLRGLKVDYDCETAGVISDDEDGPFDPVLAGYNSKEVDQRQGLLHHVTQSPVFVVIWVDTAISISEQHIVSKRIIVRPLKNCRD